MSKLPHIKFSITAGVINSAGYFSSVTIRRIEDAADAYGGNYPKYLDSIIMHALSHAPGIEIGQNDRFPYTFPFKLA
jgi:hypothetical protein